MLIANQLAGAVALLMIISSAESYCEPKQTEDLLRTLNEVLQEAKDGKNFGLGHESDVSLDKRKSSVSPAKLNEGKLNVVCDSENKVKITHSNSDKDMLSFTVKGTSDGGEFEFTTCVRSLNFEFDGAIPEVRGVSPGRPGLATVKSCSQTFSTTSILKPWYETNALSHPSFFKPTNVRLKKKLLETLMSGNFLWVLDGLAMAFAAKWTPLRDADMALVNVIPRCYIEALREAKYRAVEQPVPGGALRINCKAKSEKDERFRVFGFLPKSGSKSAQETKDFKVSSLSGKAVDTSSVSGTASTAGKSSGRKFQPCLAAEMNNPKLSNDDKAWDDAMVTVNALQNMLCQPFPVVKGLVELKARSSKVGKCVLDGLVDAGFGQGYTYPTTAEYKLEFDCRDANAPVLRIVIKDGKSSELKLDTTKIAEKCARGIADSGEKAKIPEQINEIVAGGCAATNIWKGLLALVFPNGQH